MAKGFAPQSSVELELHSTPVKLASLVADPSGTINSVVTIPVDAAVGPHTIVAVGRSPAGMTRTVSASVVVQSGLPVSGGNSLRDALIALMILALGLIATGSRLMLEGSPVRTGRPMP
jgi:hypothetical protein